ncbi:MAG: hypothetical protein LIO81_07155 [Clostridiales bacterium]|nr:hypothetical protein [Clostridiales bacterium]
MKKTIFKAVVLAVVLAVTPICAFGAGSTSRDSSDSDSGSSSSSSSSSSGTTTGTTITVGTGQTATTVTTSGSGTGSAAVVENTDGSKPNITHVTVVTTAGTSSPSVYGLFYDTTTSTGEAITRNDLGNAVTGDTAISIQQGEQATAGLPQNTVNTINAINNGNLGAVPGANLSGYRTVGSTIPLFTWDATTLTEKTGNVEVTVYLSDLPQVGNVNMIMFYNNHTGQWNPIAPTRVDAAKGLVSFVIPGAGTAVALARE